MAACLVAQVAVSSAGAAYFKPSACLQNVPYSPPHEGWSAESHWSWLPLGVGCTYLNLEDGDVIVVDDVSWTSSLATGAAALVGLALLARAARLSFRPSRSTGQ